MFRPFITQLAERAADVIDDMLVGDFEYVEDHTGLYADIDYYREHPHRVELRPAIARRPACRPAYGAARTSAGLTSQAPLSACH